MVGPTHTTTTSRVTVPVAALNIVLIGVTPFVGYQRGFPPFTLIPVNISLSSISVIHLLSVVPCRWIIKSQVCIGMLDT